MVCERKKETQAQVVAECSEHEKTIRFLCSEEVQASVMDRNCRNMRDWRITRNYVTTCGRLYGTRTYVSRDLQLVC